MLEVSQVSIAFDKAVIESVSFSVQPGDIIGIVGASGGGKSSLLKVIAGLLDATSGDVFLHQQKVKGPSGKLVPGHPEIQLVNQDFGLDMYHSVEENIIQKMLYLPNDLRTTFCTELLDLVELDNVKSQKAISLSGGEQQRLAIARALAVEPEVLLLDEPFSHLDAHLKRKIGMYLKELACARNLMCILVSHEGQDVLEWSNSIHFIVNGHIQRTATPLDFYFKPISRYEGLFFGEINEVKHKGEVLLFRPNEFKISDKKGIKVQFVSAQFLGAYWRNTVCTERNETVVLFAQEPLKKITHFVIRKHEA